MGKLIRELLVDEEGATALEYGLIAALVSIAVIVSLTNIGQSLNSFFFTASDPLESAANNMPDIN